MRRESDGENRRLREEMVRTQIASRGIDDPLVLRAMREVPRELMVRPEDIRYAFHDGPLSIGHGQTISQPYIVAYMTQELGLRPADRVLEIGTGCGYQTAVLAEIAAEVYTVEVVPELAEQARERLGSLGYANISFHVGDGTRGWPEHAPYDAIIVTAAPESVPEALKEQLADGGRLVLPVGAAMQHLVRIARRGDRFDEELLIAVRFVPLVGGPRRGGEE
ncbi:MAG: protein-L-isoaspartate(D-aspartate) O-methyltransferase [Candidatus Krumholzibacteria bacterium]|nr:protein-L-isoaspartate(D-aspartate) O-methyltransferase [Candidatus Krumholzibacteria bacterium]